MHIAMIGAGYVGLVSGACFADFGHQVTCVDLDAEKIAALSRGEIPIFEPGLDGLIADNLQPERLNFTTDLVTSVKNADVVFIAVGTPARRGEGDADLSYVYDAARSVAEAMDGFTIVVTKSTVPPGTGDEVERIIRATSPDADFVVVSNPEFMREGAAIHDFKLPDRIVIGTDDAHAREVMAEVYRPLYLNQAPLMFTTRRSAELIKYAANAFLAMKVTFINEMADLCDAVGGNVQEVAHGVGLDKRIGPKFLNAGPGFGGSCFPKDTAALVKTAQSNGVTLSLVEATIAANANRKQAMAETIMAHCGGSVYNKTIGILGLTFKHNTNDMREAPSISIIQGLCDRGANIKAFDPEGMAVAKMLLPDIEYVDDAYAAADGVDALVIVTEWNAFRALDLDRIRKGMRRPILVDLRNIYRHDEIARYGFEYHSIGRPMGA